MLRFSTSSLLGKTTFRYLLAVAAAALALFLRSVLTPLLGSANPYHTAWLGVVFCAWFCGLGPSIAATAIMLLGVWVWFIPHGTSFWATSTSQVFGVLGFTLFAGVIITIGERARRTQAKLNEAHDAMETAVRERTAELAEANEKLRQLTRSLMHLQDEERRRFARDLHDSVGQLLAVISMNLVAFESENLAPDAIRLLGENQQLVEQISTEIRTISHLLHPPLLDEAGLGAALKIYVDGFSQRSKVETKLDIPDDLPRLSQDLEISIFRIVQESLTNIHKHAGARSVAISIHCAKATVVLTVADDGKGLPVGRSFGVGLRGMEERVRQLQGSFGIDSSSRGTTITVTMPVVNRASLAHATG
ncbi:MAG TPA: sensor histidine kinase [Candidatus Acidoferrum sp.]|nr:sensor histidine kinase [Candidatus Acidoferrum sp.]